MYTDPRSRQKLHSDGPGYGPTGRLRNFAAMNEAKLTRVARDVRWHGCPVARAAVAAEIARRQDA